MAIGIAIGTYGDLDIWQPLVERALKSVENQTVRPDAIKWVHGRTLAEARNDAVRSLGTHWIACLDADDELEPQYIEKMIAAREKGGNLFYPLVGHIYPDGKRVLEKKVPCDLHIRNYIVVGAMFEIQAFEKVGGFLEEPVFEDWSLWLRMFKAGLVDIRPSEAIYIHHYNPLGRNQQSELIAEWYWKIRNGF